MGKKVIIIILSLTGLYLLIFRGLAMIAFKGSLNETETVYSLTHDKDAYSVIWIHGGATDTDYLQVSSNGLIIYNDKISGPLDIKEASIDDSLYISFKEPIYFIDDSVYKTSIAIEKDQLL